MFSRISKLFMVCIMLIVIGGVQQVTAVEMEAGTWTQKADMPTGRSSAGSAVVDGKIYVIGGNPIEGIGDTAAVEEYDPATDTWTRRADMPTARQGVVAAAVDGIVYAIGGCHIATDRDLPTVEAYDPAADTWTTKADMPTARTISAIAVVDGQIYVIGGVLDYVVLSAVEAYDPATDTWTTKADMPTAIYFSAACVVDGRIYVSGGKKEWKGRYVPTVEVYDPATDTWTQTSDMPMAKYGHSASVVAGKMYIVGGENMTITGLFLEGKIELDAAVTIHVYDPATDTWTTAADFPYPVMSLTAAVVDGKIYAIGGSWGPEYAKLSTVEEYDPGLPGVISSLSPAGKLLRTWGQVKKVQ